MRGDMKKRLATIKALLLLFCVLPPTAAIAQEQKTTVSDQAATSDVISGRYDGLVKGPSVGDMYITMQIKNDNGNVTGTIVAAGSTLQITSGTYAENRLIVKFQVAGSEVAISAHYQEGKLAGNYTLGGETGTVELKKVEAGGETDPGSTASIARISKAEWQD